MNVLEQVVLAFQTVSHGVRVAFRPSLWVPWLVLLAVQLSVIFAFSWFAHPAVSWLAAPMVQALAGEGGLRYPNVFRFLPVLYGRADLVVSALVGSLAVGAATALFGARFAGRPIAVAEGMRRGWARFGALVVANLPVGVLLLGFTSTMDWMIEEHDGPSAIRRLAALATLSVAVLLQGFFIWINPLLMLGGRGLGAAFAALPRAAAYGGWTGITLAVIAILPLMPVQLLARSADAIVNRGFPEMVAGLMVAQAVIALISAFVFTACGTLAYQTLVAPALEENR